MTGNALADFVRANAGSGRLVVQPRMGYTSIPRMREGLEAVRAARATTVGTLTVDSYTRLGQHDRAREAMHDGTELNGYPLVAHGARATDALLAGLASPSFPVQLRHGSPLPLDLFRVMIDAGITATEGGPVSYCLPYGRTPLDKATRCWADSCQWLAQQAGSGLTVHLETFGGCMMGQLCPPGLLVALSVLECMFFVQHGITSVSLSYAQQTSPRQDREALRALRRLAGEYLGQVDRHLVLYTYMGMFPRTEAGAERALRDSVRLARAAGVERLIVKTTAEAHRIPTIKENTRALEIAAEESTAPVAAPEQAGVAGSTADGDVYRESRTLIEAVRSLHDDLGRALVIAFRTGLLDIPYCLHPDNANLARVAIDTDGCLQWRYAGRMPVGAVPAAETAGSPAFEFLEMLGRVALSYDNPLPAGPARPALTGLQPHDS